MPVDKGGNDLDPSNYRPISTLSALTQIFEKLICEQLVNYLEISINLDLERGILQHRL